MTEVVSERERCHRNIYRKVNRATETFGLESLGFDLGFDLGDCHYVLEEREAFNWTCICLELVLTVHGLCRQPKAPSGLGWGLNSHFFTLLLSPYSSIVLGLVARLVGVVQVQVQGSNGDLDKLE